MQTTIGSALSSALGCYCKWPNDLINESGVKLGGVLVESSTSESVVRVGVGVNRESAVVDGTEVSGWLDCSPEMELMDIFSLIEATLASLFDSHSKIPATTESELVEVSWNGLANTLSRGVFIRTDDNESRVVCLDESGRLEIEGSGQVSITGEVGSIDWVFPSN